MQSQSTVRNTSVFITALAGACSTIAQIPKAESEPFGFLFTQSTETRDFFSSNPFVFRNQSVAHAIQSELGSDAPNTPFHDAGLLGTDQIIGLIDGAPDLTHCSLWDPESDPPGPDHAKFAAYNAEPSALSSHGTHIASIIAGHCPLDLTPTHRTGQAPQARLAFSPVPQSGLEMFDLFALHASQGAFIHNNSWGDASTGSYSDLAHHADRFVYESEAHLLVFATVNSGDVRSPENAKNVLSVSASGGLNVSIPITDFARGGLGPTADGRLKPDLMAPGTEVLGATKREDAEAVPALSLQARTGTSQATAVVSGAAAIARQYYTQGYYPSGAPQEDDGFTPSAALLKATLLNSTIDVTGIPGFPNNTEGWGRLHLPRTLSLPGSSRTLFVDDRWNAEGLVTASIVEHEIEVTHDTEPLAITLVWTDPPASAGAWSVAINNLDLELISPSGERYFGNVFADNAHSATGGTPDPLNNVEQIRILHPQPGAWTIRILGTEVRRGEQGFALVASGAFTQKLADQPLAFELPPLVIPPASPQVVSLTATPSCTDVVVELSLDKNSWAEIQAIESSQGRYTVELPRIPCGTQIFVRARATTPLGRTLHAPPLGSTAAWITRTVGQPNRSVVLNEDFESGLAEDWSASGLWNATELCTAGTENPAPVVAYFGQPGPCNFDTGYRVSGQLLSPDIPLPALEIGERLELKYRSRLDAEISRNVDIAEMSVNGVLLDRPPVSNNAWNERIFDLTSHAGGSIRLGWLFDSVDAVNNQSLGWQIDDIRISRVTTGCPPCPGDSNNDMFVNARDFTGVLLTFGQSGEGLSTDHDMNGIVDVRDFIIVLLAFGQSCH